MWTDSGRQAAWTGGAAMALLVLVAVLGVTRLAGLDDRFPHHDEMVHVHFAEQLAFEGTYQADPTFHGPLLYHLEAGVFRLFGRGLWQARLVPALAGIAAALALVWLAWREQGRAAALGVALVVTLAPTWIYYSRFNAHDTLILVMTAVLAWARWQWDRGAVTRATWLIVLALALAWSTKLNALFLVGAIALWPVVRRVAAGRDGLLVPLSWPHWTALTSALAVSGVLVVALYATTYVAHRATAGPVDALWATLRAFLVDPVTHWTAMHQRERLGGPFHFYAALLFLYEPLVILGASVALLGAWRRRAYAWTITAALIAGGLLLALASWPTRDVVRQVLHLHPVHLAALPLFAAAMWTLLRDRGRAGDTAGVWWTWMAGTQTLLYSYAGEKVPWLVVHVALPWYMLAGPAIAGWWSRQDRRQRLAARTVILLLAALTTRGAIAVTTWHRSDVGEPIVQVEYDEQSHVLMRRVSAMCTGIVLDDGACVATIDEAQWFVEWYLRSMPGDTNVGLLDDARATTPFIFAPARRGGFDAARRAVFEGTHDIETARFGASGTWVEWTVRPRPADLWHFWVFRRSLGPRRGTPYELWVRRDLWSDWRATDRSPTPANGQTP